MMHPVEFKKHPKRNNLKHYKNQKGKIAADEKENVTHLV
jgi:hypothetical protein